jgi:GntR family transcriptional regulator
MLIVVDPHSGVPVYRQLMDQIKFHVASGLLEPGDELPSTRSLSAELGVNPMTISKAYSYLEREEVVERRPGRPLVIRAHGARTVRQSKLDQLAKGLEPAVTMVKQLGISREDAGNLFNDLLLGEGTQDDIDKGEDMK